LRYSLFLGERFRIATFAFASRAPGYVSYSRNVELPVEDADDVPDTVQWWFGGGGRWRLRTYAIDHDIHTYKIGNHTLELAQANNQKHYGEIIRAQYVIHFVNCADTSELAAEFGRIGLCPRLEISPDADQSETGFIRNI
jgi:hypothetical protein